LPAGEEDERMLVERAKNRDPDAFAELYDRHFLRIYRFVYSRVRDPATAEDVTSEVFFRALKNIGRYQHLGRPFSAWLFQIAVNSAVDCYRSSHPVEDIDRYGELTVVGPTPEEVAAHRDEVRRVWSVVQVLPRQQRTAIILKFQEDMKIEDIAVAMGKTRGAVKLLIRRGLIRVRQTLGAVQPEPDRRP
jgi:RNA polymerase sigma-70 factor (ECF subfamily)